MDKLIVIQKGYLSLLYFWKEFINLYLTLCFRYLKIKKVTNPIKIIIEFMLNGIVPGFVSYQND